MPNKVQTLVWAQLKLAFSLKGMCPHASPAAPDLWVSPLLVYAAVVPKNFYFFFSLFLLHLFKWGPLRSRLCYGNWYRGLREEDEFVIWLLSRCCQSMSHFCPSSTICRACKNLLSLTRLFCVHITPLLSILQFIPVEKRCHFDSAHLPGLSSN